MTRTDYRTPGFVALGIGAAALITGAVLIGLDVSQRKKANAKPNAKANDKPAASARPRVVPTANGIGFRF